MNQITSFLLDLITSKKFTSTQLGITSIVMLVCYNPNPYAIAGIAFIVGCYNVGQGLADFGKGAQIDAH